MQLYLFWDIIQSKLVHKSSYSTSFRVMRMRLPGLQDNDKLARKLGSEGLSED